MSHEPKHAQNSNVSPQNPHDNGGADLCPSGSQAAPEKPTPHKPLVNYPPAERMREISAALGAYLARRDGVEFDVKAVSDGR